MALNKDAMTTLRETLPKASEIKPTYVHADSKQGRSGPAAQRRERQRARSRADIDFYYLGDPGDPVAATARWGSSTPACRRSLPRCPTAADVPTPANLDPADFRQLRSRMLSTALAFADLDGKVCNNTSVVLLDRMERQAAAVRRRCRMGSGLQGGQGQLRLERDVEQAQGSSSNGPLAFLKIGHHGSVNATPWQMPGAAKGEPLAILDAILPVASKAERQGGGFDASWQLRDDPAVRPAGGDRQSGVQHQDLCSGFCQGRPEDVGRAEIRQVREASRSPSRSRFAPISSACWGRTASSTLRSTRKRDDDGVGKRWARSPFRSRRSFGDKFDAAFYDSADGRRLTRTGRILPNANRQQAKCRSHRSHRSRSSEIQAKTER